MSRTAATSSTGPATDNMPPPGHRGDRPLRNAPPGPRRTATARRATWAAAISPCECPITPSGRTPGDSPEPRRGRPSPRTAPAAPRPPGPGRPHRDPRAARPAATSRASSSSAARTRPAGGQHRARGQQRAGHRRPLRTLARKDQDAAGAAPDGPATTPGQPSHRPGRRPDREPAGDHRPVAERGPGRAASASAVRLEPGGARQVSRSRPAWLAQPAGRPAGQQPARRAASGPRPTPLDRPAVPARRPAPGGSWYRPSRTS